MKLRSVTIGLGMALVLSSHLLAGTVLIVNGALGTSEPGTTAAITNNLSTLETGVGNTVTVLNDIPTDLSPYRQVWDIRFSNTFALTPAQQNEYLGFLQGGGGMFLMGENAGFAARNDSIFAFINLAGGGSLGLAGSCDGRDTQTVDAAFTAPNPVTSVTYNCAGYFDGKGTGNFITNNGTIGAGVAWGVGSLSNAPTGALTSILDVNFMEGNGGVDQQNLTKNLVGFVSVQVNDPIPEPATYLMFLSGLVTAVVLRRFRQT